MIYFLTILQLSATAKFYCRVTVAQRRRIILPWLQIAIISFNMSAGGSQSQASSSQNTTDYIRSATFSRPDGPSGDAVTASDLLMGAYDPTRLHPLADLGDKLDYLLLDDDKTNELPGAGTAIPSRGWSDDLCYGTGTMYLSGE